MTATWWSSPLSLDEPSCWPDLPLEAWADTCRTLQMWLQIVGKIKMSRSAPQNHWWHCVYYLTSRGLTTAPIPDFPRTFEAEFDFCQHHLLLRTSDGVDRHLPLYPRTVADFYRELLAVLSTLGIEVKITARPDEVPEPIPFAEDTVHRSYDAEYAHRFWRVLLTVDSLLKEHRSPFLGKTSPVHFFWGGMDLALSFFSGKRAPPRPGADRMSREAFSHEEISCGFWPGDQRFPAPAFYAYTLPEPAGFASAAVRPEMAFYSRVYNEFLLRYQDVRTLASPTAAVREFLSTTYNAGAALAHWDRASLERRAGQ